MEKLTPKEFRVASAVWRKKSIEEISKEVGYSEDEVRELVESLKDRGVVYVEKNEGQLLVETCV